MTDTISTTQSKNSDESMSVSKTVQKDSIECVKSSSEIQEDVFIVPTPSKSEPVKDVFLKPKAISLATKSKNTEDKAREITEEISVVGGIKRNSENNKEPDDDCKEDVFLLPKSLGSNSEQDVFIEPKPISVSSKAKHSMSQQQEVKPTQSYKSPAEKLAERAQPIPYREPAWSGMPDAKYSLEVLRGGVFVENVPLTKPYIVLGRSETCDMKLENPTISRFHCVIQYKTNTTGENAPGMYLYDLGSTHGTFHNKRQIEPKTYCRFRVGHMAKFGRSERLYILHGPSEDEEEPSPYSVTELMQMAAERKKELQLKEKNSQEQEKEDDTKSTHEVSWGMAEDAVEEDDDWSVNPFATNEELSLDDPKKTLKGWFEREGHDPPEYNVTEIGPGNYKCQIEIPFPNGSSVSCSVEHKGKKKDTMTQCALQACQLIHEKGLLKQATHESLSKKHEKNWAENDYYDSDEDEFLDRTGSIQAKRKKRQLADNEKPTVETFESLKAKYSQLDGEMTEVETNLEKSQSYKSKYRSHTLSEDMDDYVHNLDPKFYDKHKIASWRLQLTNMSKEEERLRKMLNLAKPSSVDEFMPRKSTLKRATQLLVKPSTTTITKRKAVNIRDVFPEDDDQPKMKLSKLDNDDDEGVKPVPYSKSLDQQKGNTFWKRQKMMASSAKRAVSPPLPKADPFKAPLPPSISKKPQPETEPPLVPSLPDPSEQVDQASSLVEEQKVVETEPSPSVEVETTIQEKVDNPQEMKVVPEPKLEFKKPKEGSSKKSTAKTKKGDLFNFEKEYESWMPPPGQTGDGKTSLNEKLGY